MPARMKSSPPTAREPAERGLAVHEQDADAEEQGDEADAEAAARAAQTHEVPVRGMHLHVGKQQVEADGRDEYADEEFAHAAGRAARTLRTCVCRQSLRLLSLMMRHCTPEECAAPCFQTDRKPPS
jgi:hypothetical protein